MGAILKNGINYTNGNSPTKTSELVNDSGFITKAVNDLVNYYLKSETYSKTEVDAIATAIKNSRFEVVATLPTTDIKTNVIYLVPSLDPQTGNVKDEYINLDGTSAGWECIGSTSVDLSGYVTTTALNTALADYVTATDLTALLAGKQDKVQYSALPTASAELEGKIFEYTGATGGGLTHGYFYECVSDGQDPATYSWVQTNVQPSGGGGGSYTAGDGIDITNNVISTKQSEEGDIDEIIDVYPQAGNLVSIVNAFNRGDIYSTSERMIGQWHDGKPIYQRVLDLGTMSLSSSTTHDDIDISTWNLETLIDCKGGGVAYKGTALQGNVTFPQNYISDLGLKISIKVSTSGDLLVVYKTISASGTFTIQNTFIIVQYTKTTDTAISIGSETEYSTDEKVVGTWITGEPIYQKTIQTTTPNCVTYGVIVEKTINLNVELDKIIKVEGFVYDGATYVCMPINSALQNSKDAVYMLRAYCYGNGASSNPNSIVIGNSIKDYNDKPCYVTVQYVKSTT